MITTDIISIKMRKNNHLNILNRLLEQHLIEEETILSQHTKEKHSVQYELLKDTIQMIY